MKLSILLVISNEGDKGSIICKKYKIWNIKAIELGRRKVRRYKKYLEGSYNYRIG